MEHFRSALAYPIISIAHVFDDRGQLHARCQAVVNGNHDITRIEHCFQQRTGPGSHLPITHHQRAAVNKNDYGPDGVAHRRMHIRLQIVRLRSKGLIGVRFEGRFIGRSKQRPG